jgi:hypothetical protein
LGGIEKRSGSSRAAQAKLGSLYLKNKIKTKEMRVS